MAKDRRKGVRIGILGFAACAALAGATQTSFQETVQPFVAKNCYGCHNDKLQSGGLNLKSYPDAASFVKGREEWEHILDKLKAGEMPPKGMPKPPAEQVAALAKWLEEEFARQDAAMQPDPGRVTARRLNRYEYNTTIRDLLNVDFRPADDFPADDYGYGFDNIGDVLTVSPALMEKYLNSAHKIARLAIDGEQAPNVAVKDRFSNRGRRPGEFTWERKFKWEADYVIRVEAATRYPGELSFSFDGGEIKRVKAVPGFVAVGRVHDFRMHVPYGVHKMTAWFEVNQEEAAIQDKKDKADAERKAAFERRRKGEPEPPPKPPESEKPPEKPFVAPKGAVDYFEVLGPYNPSPPPTPDSYKRVFICGHTKGEHNASCVRKDLENLARLAWRRPVTDAEVRKLTGYVKMAQDNGDSLDNAMKVGVEAVLVSPYFLFRIERDPNPNTPHRVSDFELASRLSYFLWSSMPDEELFRLAKESKLHNPQVLAQQVERMLRDRKSDALVDNFGGQWLQTRNLDAIKPDPDKFGAFTPDLRAAMKKETQLFFSNIIHEDLSILEFLTAKYTFVNEPLAKLYGIPNVKGDEFRKVDLTGTPRVGVLTQASVLTVSSYPTRTSPVIRGKWILENILNTPPPPPPANVPSLKDGEVGTATSLRESLEKHRSDAICAGCHAKMDPLGFGLENFDAIGRYRTQDGKFPIDSSGVLPNGKHFSDAEELIHILQDDKDQFTRCLVEKLLTFAIGRGLERYDRPVVSAIAKHVAENGYKFSILVTEIINSAPFQMRHGEVSQTKQLVADRK